MLPSLGLAGNRLAHAIAPGAGWTPASPSAHQCRWRRPNLGQLAQPNAVLPAFVADDAVARKYLDLLGPLDWAHFPERPTNHPWPGPTPAPRAPYVAAYLVKLNEGLRSMGHLRRYLVEHPALVWLLGFPLTPDPTAPHGFDVAALPALPPPTRPRAARTRQRRRPVPARRPPSSSSRQACPPTSTSATSSPATPSTSWPGSRRITPSSTSKTATTRPGSPRAIPTASSAARNAATRAKATATRCATAATPSSAADHRQPVRPARPPSASSTGATPPASSPPRSPTGASSCSPN